MSRMKKIPIQTMDVRPEPRPMYPPNISGGNVCVICKNHLDGMDGMEGSGVVKKVRKTAKKAGKYITDVEGLASDVVNFGIPAATSTLLGAPATAVGGPAAGILASAIGAKLGTMAADKIADETAIQSRYEGGAIKPKRKARFEKGSQAAKDHMAKIREARQKK
jgi:hypothetical protein